jgi:hypothetical protein
METYVTTPSAGLPLTDQTYHFPCHDSHRPGFSSNTKNGLLRSFAGTEYSSGTFTLTSSCDDPCFMDNCQPAATQVCLITHLVTACLHKSSDFIPLVSIVINKVMDIEEQYSGWNRCFRTHLAHLAQMIATLAHSCHGPSLR